MTFAKTGFLAALIVASAVAFAATAEESAQYKSLLTPLLATDADIIEQPIVYPPGSPKVTAAVVTIEPGAETGWHTHEVPLFVQVLEGEVTVDYGSKGTKVYKAGEAIMEAMNWPHNGFNKTTAPVRILAVYMGSDEKTNTATASGPK
jgi:quercetin dioxygenase-like cupin family protein